KSYFTWYFSGSASLCPRIMNQNQSFNQEIDALNVAKLLQKQLIGGVLSDHEVVFLKQWCALYDKDNTLLEAVQTNNHELLSKLFSVTGYATESKFNTDESLKRVLVRI